MKFKFNSLAYAVALTLFLAVAIAFGWSRSQAQEQNQSQTQAGIDHMTRSESSARGILQDPKHPILPIGAPAPDFNLPGVDGKNHKLSDYADAKVLVVLFECNHCPFMQDRKSTRL